LLYHVLLYCGEAVTQVHDPSSRVVCAQLVRLSLASHSRASPADLAKQQPHSHTTLCCSALESLRIVNGTLLHHTQLALLDIHFGQTRLSSLLRRLSDAAKNNERSMHYRGRRCHAHSRVRPGEEGQVLRNAEYEIHYSCQMEYCHNV